MKVFGDIRSGNCYKIKLTASLLDIPHEWVHMDITRGETRTPEFLRKNPNGKIPVLELDSGEYLSESNAIINYLAAGSFLLPTDPLSLARVQQWQFFEQYSHEPFIAVARYIAVYLGMPEDRKSEYDSKQAGGYRALGVMEQQLNQTPFLVGQQLTTADIALYGYTHVAHEGGFDLTGYPAVQHWLNRVTALPGYVPMV